MRTVHRSRWMKTTASWMCSSPWIHPSRSVQTPPPGYRQDIVTVTCLHVKLNKGTLYIHTPHILMKYLFSSHIGWRSETTLAGTVIIKCYLSPNFSHTIAWSCPSSVSHWGGRPAAGQDLWLWEAVQRCSWREEACHHHGDEQWGQTGPGYQVFQATSSSRGSTTGCPWRESHVCFSKDLPQHCSTQVQKVLNPHMA